MKVEAQVEKEAKERQRLAGGDKVSEKAKAVTSNLTEAVEPQGETAEIMAKKIDAESPPGTGSRSVEECQK